MPPRRSSISFNPGAKAPFTPAVSRSEAKGSGTAVIQRLAHPTHQQIAERAYQIYLKRGSGPGNAFSDWIEAERQLKAGNL